MNASHHVALLLSRTQSRFCTRGSWDTLRRYSEFEALLHFLTESPKAGTCGPKLKQLVSSTPKSIRFVGVFAFLKMLLLSQNANCLVPLTSCTDLRVAVLVLFAGQYIRSVLAWSMLSPEFLEDRRSKMETTLVVLLDALRIPTAVCGFRGLSFSTAGQV